MKHLMTFVIVVLVALSLGACSSDGPAVKAAKKAVKAATDQRMANDINEAAEPQQIRCDAGTPGLRFINGSSDEPLVYYAKDESGKIICYDAPGFVSRGTKFGTPLMPVTRGIVAEILRQPCPPPPPPAPRPAPLPVVNDGPCCTQ